MCSRVASIRRVFRVNSEILSIGISLILFIFAPIAAFAQNVTVANASVKIRPADGPGPVVPAVMKAAQNEFEAVQFVITGPTTGVSVTPPTLVGPGGATIPANEVRLYRVDYIDVQTPSNIEGATGLWPYALIPDVDEIVNEKRNAFPIDVPAGQNRVVWLQVHVPLGQTPGTYEGSLLVTGTGLGTTSVPVTLHVWDFALPSTSSLPSTFGMGWNSACVAHYGSYEACGGDAGVEQMHLLYARFMLDHRITADVVYFGPTNCSGITCDWSHFDATYGPLFDGTAPSLRLVGAKQTSIRYVWNGTSNSYAAWAQHFRAKGWFDRTFDYTCDEPPDGCTWSAIVSRASLVHGADPEFRTLVTTNIDAANTNGVTSSINIIVPVVNHMEDKPGYSQFSGNQRPNYDSFLQSNERNRLWWYQSCMSHGCSGETPGDPYFSGWPSLVVDTSAVQNRAQGILSWLYGVSGVLYFRIDERLSTAWSNIYAFGGNGDGTLVLPGKPSLIGGQTHIPVASIPLVMIREGFEDYEYMKLVADLGDPGFAQQIGHGLFPNTFSSNQTAASLYEAREALAQRILELKGSPPTGPTVSMTAPVNGATVSGVITWSATASDPAGIAGVQLVVDGNPTGSEITTPPYSATFNTASLVNGTHSFAAQARNTADVKKTSTAVVVTVSNGNSSPGQLSLVSALILSPASPAANQAATATFTVQNKSQQPASVSYFFVGARDPLNGNVDFPASSSVTLQPRQQYTLQGSAIVYDRRHAQRVASVLRWGPMD